MNKHERESGDGVFTQKSPVSFKHILDFHPDASIWWVLFISKGGGGSGKAEEKAMNGAQRRLFQYPDMTTPTWQRQVSFPTRFGLFQVVFVFVFVFVFFFCVLSVSESRGVFLNHRFVRYTFTFICRNKLWMSRNESAVEGRRPPTFEQHCRYQLGRFLMCDSAASSGGKRNCTTRGGSC